MLPADAEVLVVEDDAGAIVGAWAVYRLVHVEGIWVAPAHRGRTVVFRRLLAGMRMLVRAFGSSVALTGAIDPVVADMLRKLGAVELPGRHFSWRV